ncbi:hypothetical protein BX666DRAFT_1977260 [Dichotomocladium elegans]|nr:hypothetical protein BX666DRAFT_1977260 [Dichotomocladium elegans]
MKILLGLALLAALNSAQLTAPTKNYNVTSPVSDGPYVVGQVLPCTYQLFSDIDSSSLNLEIALEPAGGSLTSNGTIVIAESADVSKTSAFAKQNGNLTYYEHSINYQIPNKVLPGSYQVVFFDKSTNTQLPVPIEIRPQAQSTSATSPTKTPGASGVSSSDKSIFAGASSTQDLFASVTLSSLVVVAGIALWL